MMRLENAPDITGERVQLRGLHTRDVDLMFQLFSSEEVVRFSRVNPLSEKESGELLQRWLEPVDDAYWAVCSPSGEGIGIAFLRNVNRAHHAAEIGYVLAKASWGKGIASDIVALITRHGFDALDLCRIEAYVSVANLPSLRVLEKNGFEIEGRRRADCFKNGEFQDAVLLSIIDEKRIAALTEQSR